MMMMMMMMMMMIMGDSPAKCVGNHLNKRQQS
jgi:hypothetical protein